MLCPCFIFTLNSSGLENYLSLCRWGENTWWFYHFVTGKLNFTEGGVSLPLNMRLSAEKPIKVQSSSLFLLSVFVLCTGTLQKGQESCPGGVRWTHCRDLCAGGNQSSEGNLCGWSAMWEHEGEYWFSCTLTEPEPPIKMWILGTFKLILQVTGAPGWWMTHTVRRCYPGFFQSFCNSEKEGVQKRTLLV